MSRFCDTAALQSRWQAETVQRIAESAAGDSGDPADSIATAIGDAESIALSILLTAFDDDELPPDVASTPGVLTNAVADVAIYELAKHQAHSRVIYKEKFDAAIAWFNRVQRGVASIGYAPIAETVDNTQPQLLASKTVDDMVFGNGGLDEW